MSPPGHPHGHPGAVDRSTIPSARTCCCAAPRKSSPMRCAMPARATCGSAAATKPVRSPSTARATTAMAPKRVIAGNGLRGMRERLRQHGGSLTSNHGPAMASACACNCRSALPNPWCCNPVQNPLQKVPHDPSLPGRRPNPGAAGHPLAAGAGRRHRGGRRGRRRQAGGGTDPAGQARRGADGHAHAGDVRAGGIAGAGRAQPAAADDHPDHLRRRPAGAGRAQGGRQGLPAQGRVAGAAGGRDPDRGRRAARWCSRR